MDERFYEKIAEKYRHEFAKLVVSLERKYKITDSDTMPRIIRDFVKWKETADLSQAFANGIPNKGEDMGDREFWRRDSTQYGDYEITNAARKKDSFWESVKGFLPQHDAPKVNIENIFI